MGKSTTPSFVISLRILPTEEDERELEYRFHAGAHLYNLCVKEARKRAHKLLKNAEYKARRKTYSGTKEEQKVLLEIRARYGLAGRKLFLGALYQRRAKEVCKAFGFRYMC